MSDNTASSNLLLTKLILTFAQLALRLPHAVLPPLSSHSSHHAKSETQHAVAGQSPHRNTHTAHWQCSVYAAKPRRVVHQQGRKLAQQQSFTEVLPGIWRWANKRTVQKKVRRCHRHQPFCGHKKKRWGPSECRCRDVYIGSYNMHIRNARHQFLYHCLQNRADPAGGFAHLTR